MLLVSCSSLFTGPIASSLTNRFGCRVVTIAGSVLAATGVYLPAIVSVSVYFQKKRAFATGIAVCGSGVGTFIMAPVTKG